MSPRRTFLRSRRDFLGAVGAGALAAGAGCTGLADAVGRVRDHVHHADANLSGSAAPWATLGADPGRTGAVEGPAPPPDATRRELTPLGRFVRTQPTVVDGRVYVGVDRRETEREDGTFSGLLAVELDEHRTPVAWRAGADRGTSFTPTVAGDAVFARVDDRLTAFDASDGSVRWWNAAGRSPPAVVGETCYTYDDGVVALDAVTGEKQWESDPAGVGTRGLAVADDAVALAWGDGGNGGLRCVERADGATRWRYDDLGESYAAPVTDGERVYAVNTAGFLHAVPLDRPQRAWSYDFGESSYQRVTVADGTVYAAGTNSEYIVALDAATGEERWRTPVGVGGPSPPAVTPDALVVVRTTQDGDRLTVLDRESGEVSYGFDVPDGFSERVQPVVGDGVAYVVAEPSERTQAYLYAVR